MRKFLFVLLISLSWVLNAAPYEGPISFEADEEVVIKNNSSFEECFRVFVCLPASSGTTVSVKGLDKVNVRTGDYPEEWKYVCTSPSIPSHSKWKSSSDYPVVEDAVAIRILTKSGRDYSYYFEEHSDKLHIIVTDLKDSDNW